MDICGVTELSFDFPNDQFPEVVTMDDHNVYLQANYRTKGGKVKASGIIIKKDIDLGRVTENFEACQEHRFKFREGGSGIFKLSYWPPEPDKKTEVIKDDHTARQAHTYITLTEAYNTRSKIRPQEKATALKCTT